MRPLLPPDVRQHPVGDADSDRIPRVSRARPLTSALLFSCASVCVHRNVSPIILSRLVSMYGAVLQQLATDASVRTLLNITAPQMTLAPSLQEMIEMDRVEGKEVPEMFLW
jgi:hypothetical protein